MVPAESGFKRDELIAPELMTPPMLWLCSDEARDVTGRRILAKEWDSSIAPVAAAKACGPAAWPSLISNIVWPGGRPT
jgi:3-oxoacyl-[acyl-carrier protein] reductase